jgi:hypothetical protein
VEIGSYLESGDLKIRCGGDFTVGKRLGIVKKGVVESERFKCGSVFSMMADLPQPGFSEQRTSSEEFERNI